MVTARRLAVVLIGLLLGLLLGACTASRTEVVLVVDTDLQGTGGIDNIVVEVTNPGSIVTRSTARLGAGEPPLPRTLGLVHEDGPLGPFFVRVIGKIGSAERVERVARFTFQDGCTLVLRIDLVAACEGVVCAAGQTCAPGGCRSVDVGELPEWTGSLPAALPFDAGVRPTDAGRVDAGPRDAGTPDLGVPTDFGPMDSGAPDFGAADLGPADLGAMDSGSMDSGPADGGSMDGGPLDLGAIDAAPTDLGPTDSGRDG
jgi:hypothetical protein